MKSLIVIVHVAGEAGSAGQDCSRCGKRLMSFEGLMVAGDKAVIRAFPVGSFVGETEVCSFVMRADATEKDEVPCGVAQ